MQLFRIPSSQARGARRKERKNSLHKQLEKCRTFSTCKHQQLSGPKRNHSYFLLNRPYCGVIWSKSLHWCLLRFFQVLWQGSEQSVSDICFVGRDGAQSLHVVGGEPATFWTTHKQLQCWSLAFYSPQTIGVLGFGFVQPTNNCSIGVCFVHPLVQIPILRWSQSSHRTGSALAVMLQESFTLAAFQKHISELRIHYFLKVPVEGRACTFPEVVLC